MLAIPDALLDAGMHAVHVHAEGCVVAYRTPSDTPATHCLVTRPTLVFVAHGTKELRPHGTDAVLVAPKGHVVAMRSGAHVMAEFVADAEGYGSTVLCFERAFLQRLIAPDTGTAPTVKAVVVDPHEHLQTAIGEFLETLANNPAPAAHAWGLRDVLISAMKHAPIRSLFSAEVADFGTTPQARVQAVMSRHHLSPLAVPEYAALCAMSVSTFARHFRSAYGTAPGKWLSHARLHHAKRLVLAGGHSVTDICDASGYGDLSNFIRAFRRAHGAPPTVLSKRSRGARS
ncbi:MAG: AraC-like DNA-binding protein [Myxococcota bacterium]|jgi:AraC-like DNA-binding protein